MNFKRKILKSLYPLVMRLSKSEKGNGKHLHNERDALPKASFYDLKITQNNGQVLEFNQLKNKKVLLVNTASDCGYTGQYAELQELSEKEQSSLTVIGFPANDFKEQEKAEDSEIAAFCKVNYGVDFPLSVKSSVVKGSLQHPVYQWLTQPGKNGWNEHEPDWNFSKYLIDEKGKLIGYFGPAISPLGKEIGKELNP